MPDVTEVAIMAIGLSDIREPFASTIKEDLEYRNAIGIETYGTTLKSHNGRDALLDLYEELLDAYKYATQYVIEQADGELPEFTGAIEDALQSCVMHLSTRGGKGILETRKPLNSPTVAKDGNQ